MAGVTDEKHVVAAGLALVAALRNLCKGTTGETADLIDEAEQYLNAVRLRGRKPAPPKPAEKE